MSERAGVRLRKFIDVVVEDKPSAMLLRGSITDISQTGMRILADQYLAKGSCYVFTMKNPPSLSLRGEVRWIREVSADRFSAGIFFADIAQADRDRLARFVELERQRRATPT